LVGGVAGAGGGVGAVVAAAGGVGVVLAVGGGVVVVVGAGAGAGVPAAGAGVALPAVAGAAAVGCMVFPSRRARSRASKPASANWVIIMTATAANKIYFFISILLQKVF
jgi:hypothetical protein